MIDSRSGVLIGTVAVGTLTEVGCDNACVSSAAREVAIDPGITVLVRSSDTNELMADPAAPFVGFGKVAV